MEQAVTIAYTTRDNCVNERLSGPPRKIFPNSSYIIQVIKSIRTRVVYVRIH